MRQIMVAVALVALFGHESWQERAAVICVVVPTAQLALWLFREIQRSKSESWMPEQTYRHPEHPDYNR